MVGIGRLEKRDTQTQPCNMKQTPNDIAIDNCFNELANVLAFLCPDETHWFGICRPSPGSEAAIMDNYYNCIEISADERSARVRGQRYTVSVVNGSMDTNNPENAPPGVSAVSGLSARSAITRAIAAFQSFRLADAIRKHDEEQLAKHHARLRQEEPRTMTPGRNIWG